MGYFFAIAAAFSWGLVYTLQQKVLTKISVIEIICINAFFTLVVLLPFLIQRLPSLKKTVLAGGSTVWFLVISVAVTLVANLLIFYAIQTLGSSKAAIFEIAYPLVVILLSYLFFNMQINAYFFIGAILIFTGSALIVTKG